MTYIVNVEVELNSHSDNPITIRECTSETGRYLLALPHVIAGDDDEGAMCDGTTEYSLFVKPDNYQDIFLKNLEKMTRKDPKTGFEALLQFKGEDFADMHEERDEVTYNPNFSECQEWINILKDYQS